MFSIKENVNNWIKTNLPNFSFRQYQEEYIIKTIGLILNDNKVTMIEAPTGSGKSIMIIIMAGVLHDIYKMPSYILCSDLFLWQQYSGAIEKYNLKFGKIKGVSDYICNKTEQEFTIAPCRLMNISLTTLTNGLLRPADYDCAEHCTYIKERIKAMSSGVTLMTYQLWLIYMNMINKNKIITEFNTFENRPIVFCDECHNIPSICQSFAQITFDLHKDTTSLNDLLTYSKDKKFKISNNVLMEDFNIDSYLFKYYELFHEISYINNDDHEAIYKKLLEIQDFLSVAIDCSSKLSIYKDSEKFKKHSKTGLNKSDIKAFKASEWICRLNDMLNIYNFYLYDKRWLIKSDNKMLINNKLEFPDNPVLTFKFAKEDIWCHNFLLAHPNNIVLMSATIGDKESFDDNIGTKFTNKESVLLQIPSTFDFSKSPIYFIPGTKMTQSSINTSFPINASIINKILMSPKHQNEKGIIHTGSYKNAVWLSELLDKSLNERIFLYGSAKEKKEVISKFAESSNGILIGPTLTEGVDLPDDGCRFIIIMKIPYPYLGDNLVKAKIDLFPKWYNATTSNNVIQGIGRGNRNKNDWSTTYILDGCFYNLYLQTINQYPNEIRQRFKIINK